MISEFWYSEFYICYKRSTHLNQVKEVCILSILLIWRFFKMSWSHCELHQIAHLQSNVAWFAEKWKEVQGFITYDMLLEGTCNIMVIAYNKDINCNTTLRTHERTWIVRPHSLYHNQTRTQLEVWFVHKQLSQMLSC